MVCLGGEFSRWSEGFGMGLVWKERSRVKGGWFAATI